MADCAVAVLLLFASLATTMSVLVRQRPIISTAGPDQLSSCSIEFRSFWLHNAVSQAGRTQVSKLR